MYHLTVTRLLGLISVCGTHTLKVLHKVGCGLNSVFNAVHGCFQRQSATFRVAILAKLASTPKGVTSPGMPAGGLFALCSLLTLPWIYSFSEELQDVYF